jgi:LTXXQ motif family protein
MVPINRARPFPANGNRAGAAPLAVTAQTPVGRLDVMHDRLAAMLNAAKTLQPVLNDFYASLNNEQKAAFNTLGREARRPG